MPDRPPVPRLGHWNHRKNTVQDFQQGNRANDDTAEINNQLLGHVTKTGVDFGAEFDGLAGAVDRRRAGLLLRHWR